MRCAFLFLLVLLGCNITIASMVSATPLLPTSQTEAALTQKDIVGLWSGSVRIPGRTDIWQFLPKFVHYDENGTAVTIYLNNTVLFREDGTFKFTVEDQDTASQYEGRYAVKDAVLTMTFPSTAGSVTAAGNSPVTFRYPISRWNEELMLKDEKEVGFQTMLSPLAMDWQPRKGSLVYQSPSGPMEFGITGTLDQSYHYDEKDITHYADVSASWHLVASASRQGEPLVKLEGVHDGADFKTLVVPLSAVSGLPKALKQIKAAPSVVGYFYTLQLLEIADTKPAQYVWAIHFDSQSGWELDAAPLPPPVLYPSLSSPELREYITHLPRGTLLSYAPRMRLFATPSRDITDPADPEYGLADFAHYCKTSSKTQRIQFYLNYAR
jgi:hypothetical protein